MRVLIRGGDRPTGDHATEISRNSRRLIRQLLTSEYTLFEVALARRLA
jgi:hypothetical protein